MRIYERPFKLFIPGSYVTIRNDQVEIVTGRYTDTVLAEMYFHEVHINEKEMKVTMTAITGEVLSVIRNAQRIVDMRTDEDE